MKPVAKTWNEFWGKFLLVDFHLDNPERWSSIERKAEWVWKTANVPPGSRLLDLGCGSGLLDICLARKGGIVTAVDRIEPVLDLARKEKDGELVNFIHGDLLDISFPSGSFDCILVLETIGLMSNDRDQQLLSVAYDWLAPNGILIIDCPKPEYAGPGSWTKELSAGALTFESFFEVESAVQTILPSLRTGQEEIVLHDPYGLDKGGDHYGVKRYLYAESELSTLLREIGFTTTPWAHYWNDTYYALIAKK